MTRSRFGFLFLACLSALFSAAAYFAAPIIGLVREAFPPTPDAELKRQSQSVATDYSIGLSQTRSFIDRLLARTDTQRRPSLALAV